MKDRTLLRLAAAALGGLILSAGFNVLFLRLPERPPLDRAIAVLLLSAALGWVFYYAASWRPSFSSLLSRFAVRKAAFRGFLQDNAAGLLLSLAFFAVYLSYGLRIAGFSARQVDNLFDTDASAWAARIAAPGGGALDLRGPHPFAYFILRPAGWALNLFTHDYYLSALLLNALAGGACVFLVWLLLKRQFENKVYAFLMAALLGLSTSHLVLGSVVETYIFSAFALILFTYLAASPHSRTASLAVSAALTFGITLTNLVQNAIVFAVSRPRWKDIFRWAGWALSIGLILTYLHAACYPSSRPFFLPSQAESEEAFFAPFEPPLWRIAGRAVLLGRTVLLTAVIAPEFYTLTEGAQSALPIIRFFRVTPGAFRYGGYDLLGKALVLVWAALLLTAALTFLLRLLRFRRADLSLAFALCLLFNLALHFLYGEDPFLYSPDWAYALIFFMAFGLARWKEDRLFLAGLLVFVLLLAIHQAQFLAALYRSLQPYLR